LTHQTREAQNLPFHPLGLGGLKGALYPWASLNSLLLDGWGLKYGDSCWTWKHYLKAIRWRPAPKKLYKGCDLEIIAGNGLTYNLKFIPETLLQ